MHKKVLLIVFLCCFVACSDYDHTVMISDVSKPEVLWLKKERLQKNVHSLSIQGRGKIEGKATVTLILNGKPYKSEQLKSDVTFKWGGDWYSDSAEIRYEPAAVASGELYIDYTFFALK